MKVLIVGAGSQAATAAEIIVRNRVFEIVGFIDTQSSEKVLEQIKVIGDHSLLPELYEKGIRNVLVAVGDNTIREQHYLKLKGLGYNFVNAIHCSTIISESVALGEGIIIEPGVVLSGNTGIGNNVIVSAGAVLGRNIEIGNNVFIGPGVTLAGNNLIKKNACIQSGVTVDGGVIVGKNAVIAPGKAVCRNVADVRMKPNERR